MQWIQKAVFLILHAFLILSTYLGFEYRYVTFSQMNRIGQTILVKYVCSCLIGIFPKVHDFICSATFSPGNFSIHFGSCPTAKVQLERGVIIKWTCSSRKKILGKMHDSRHQAFSSWQREVFLRKRNKHSQRAR